MWHVFSWTKTTRRNLEGVWTFKDDSIHILFNVFASFRMDLAASLLTKGQCDAVSHQQRRVPSFTLHVEFDTSRSSVVYRNAPKYTSLSCGYTLPEINIDLLQLLRVVWLLKMLLHIFMADLEQKMTPMRYTRYTKRGCDCHFAILCPLPVSTNTWGLGNCHRQRLCTSVHRWNLWQDFPEEVVVRFMLIVERKPLIWW